MASNFLTEALDKALEEFGTYSYYDKGVDEVMHTGELIRRLDGMSADEVVEATDVLLTHEHGNEFYEYIYAALVEDEDHPEARELKARMRDLSGELIPKPLVIERRNFGDLF